jgi:glycerophosphoryl diester phosphodiesterase
MAQNIKSRARCWIARPVRLRAAAGRAIGQVSTVEGRRTRQESTGSHAVPRPPYTTHDHPLAFGHRGAAAHCPENTLPSFRRALAAGADALELDIHPTRDGIPVIIHDDTVDRTTGGAGLVREMSLAQTSRLDAGFRFTRDGGAAYPFRGTSVQVPTLEQLLSISGPARLNIDFKETSPAMEDEVWRLIERFGAHDRVLVCSSADRVAWRVRRRFPGLPTSACTVEVAAMVVMGWFGLARLAVPAVAALQVPVSQAGIPVLTRRLVEVAHDHGVAVHVWTVNDATAMRSCLDLGVDGIMSDDPERLLEVMGRSPGR